jgi:hypothetical protein
MVAGCTVAVPARSAACASRWYEIAAAREGNVLCIARLVRLSQTVTWKDGVQVH